MRLLSIFSPKAPLLLVYMLQQFEYHPGKFISWFMRMPDVSQVQKRGKLTLTGRAKLMLLMAYGIWLFVVLIGLVPALVQSKPALLIVCLAAPFITALDLYIVTYVLQASVVNPKQNTEIKRAKAKLATSTAVKIAVIGSYGKTTMKELLSTVLSEAKKVAATPGNKNILISHARWVNGHIAGDEEVLVFEYGEAKPGDISSLASFSQPAMAVVTGLAPAHLDEYASLDDIADDFADIQQTVQSENIYINSRSDLLKQKIQGNYYSETGLGEWKVSNVQIDFDGTKFTVQHGSKKLHLHTKLLGTHQIGPLTAVIAIASQLGLSEEEIQRGIAATQPYEHRMQPRHLHGAWIIDDTYNGNIEGMRAGLELLKKLPGKKKIYVTPGLVDQGGETERVHQELGQLIAAAAPDRVVLMQNSNTNYIKSGLEAGNYSGELITEGNPLEYYTNLEHYLAAGDVVLLQNDLPDSYK